MIPLPTGEREVLKVNVFERMIGANTVLMPLFPYLGPGAMLVAGAMPSGGRTAFGNGGGTFYHQNSREEVTLTYGASEFVRSPGEFVCNPDNHVNKNFFTVEDPADRLTVVTVTQRQADPEDAENQREAIKFRCAGCGNLLYEFAYSAVPGEQPRHDGEPSAGNTDDVDLLYSTLWGTATAGERFSNDVELRTCDTCGLVADSFDVARLGAPNWVAGQRAANIARTSLITAAEEV